MLSSLNEDLKKIFLAGLGAAAFSAEKSKQVVDELVKRGELTLEQGKILNEELRRNIKEKIAVQEPEKADAPMNFAGVEKEIGRMNRQQLEELRGKIAEAEASAAPEDDVE
jgi:polyhydroxyalkanoate synthesis regulator phasin